MSELFASGRIVDVVIAFMVVEALAIVFGGRWLGHRLGNLDIAVMLVPGLFLLLAMRAVMTGAGWEVTAGWLIASLIAHMGDLVRRLRGD